MKNLILFASLFTSFSAFGALRVAERYTCTAFNPLTGYAEIAYSENGKGTARMTSVAGEHVIRGGRLTYNTGTASSFPRAVFHMEINGVQATVYMDLTRPLNDGCEDQLAREEILTGITYIPAYVGNVFLPLPAGIFPTAVVTCRVEFQ